MQCITTVTISLIRKADKKCFNKLADKDGWMDGWMDGWKEGRKDGLTGAHKKIWMGRLMILSFMSLLTTKQSYLDNGWMIMIGCMQ